MTVAEAVAERRIQTAERRGRRDGVGEGGFKIMIERGTCPSVPTCHLPSGDLVLVSEA